MYTLIDWAFTLACWFLVVYLPLTLHKPVYLLVGVAAYILYPIMLELLYNLYGYYSYTDDEELRKQKIINEHVGLPLVYHPNYNITACGIEKLHPFDSCKYERIYQALIQSTIIKPRDVYQPQGTCARGLLLQLGMSRTYLLSLCYMEIPVCILPGAFLRQRLLDPMLWCTQGSIDAAQLALKYGWAINIGGGYHHASLNSGGGFCVYPDITLAIKYVRKFYKLERVMIVDLDAHQGNGHERDFLNDASTYIIDFFNHAIYPHDTVAADAIQDNVSVSIDDDDSQYVSAAKEVMLKAVLAFQPQFVLYNAGTDCMQNDPLGRMSLTPNGIMQRDHVIFNICVSSKIPILMVLSGGYQQINAPTIAQSISNLVLNFRI